MSNNPITTTDPDGKNPLLVVLGVIASAPVAAVVATVAVTAHVILYNTNDTYKKSFDDTMENAWNTITGQSSTPQGFVEVGHSENGIVIPSVSNAVAKDWVPFDNIPFGQPYIPVVDDNGQVVGGIPYADVQGRAIDGAANAEPDSKPQVYEKEKAKKEEQKETKKESEP